MTDDAPVRKDDAPEVDPEDFLRKLLALSPEDAAKAREEAAELTKPYDPEKHG